MSELANKKDTDLRKDLALARKSFRDFRFGVAGSKIKNMREARTARREAARILTELSARRKRLGAGTDEGAK